MDFSSPPLRSYNPRPLTSQITLRSIKRVRSQSQEDWDLACFQQEEANALFQRQAADRETLKKWHRVEGLFSQLEEAIGVFACGKKVAMQITLSSEAPIYIPRSSIQAPIFTTPRPSLRRRLFDQ
jgi:hypothetical protein